MGYALARPLRYGVRDTAQLLSGVVKFDHTYLEDKKWAVSRAVIQKRLKVFVALALDNHGNPQYLKMGVTPNLKQASVKKFAHQAIASGSTIRSDGYPSYIPTNIRLMTPRVGCSIGYISWSATQRHSF